MNKAKLAVVAGIASVMIAPAHAADLGVRPAYPAAVAPVPVFSWTGCYIGAHAGAGWGDKTVSVPSIVPGESVTGHIFGPLGGGQVGCNLQFGGLVMGVEGEGAAADIKGDTTQTITGVIGTASARRIGSRPRRVGLAGRRIVSAHKRLHYIIALKLPGDCICSSDH